MNMEPDWFGLLKWSLRHSDGTAPSHEADRQMTEEDRAFLEKAMKASIRDDPNRLSSIMQTFTTFLDEGDLRGREREDELEALLDELRDIVEQIDMAQVFVKFGGLEALLRFAERENIGLNVRCLAISVIGTLSQNNLSVQTLMHEKGAIDRLIKLGASTAATVETGDSAAAAKGLVTLAAKALYATSCIVRSNPAAEQYFCDVHLDALSDAMSRVHIDETNRLLARRAIFLGGALVSSDSATPARRVDVLKRLLPAALSLLRAPDPSVRWDCLSFLLSLAASRTLWAVASPYFDNPLLEEALSERESAAGAVLAAATTAAAVSSSGSGEQRRRGESDCSKGNDSEEQAQQTEEENERVALQLDQAQYEKTLLDDLRSLLAQRRQQQPQPHQRDVVGADVRREDGPIQQVKHRQEESSLSSAPAVLLLGAPPAAPPHPAAFIC